MDNSNGFAMGKIDTSGGGIRHQVMAMNRERLEEEAQKDGTIVYEYEHEEYETLSMDVVEPLLRLCRAEAILLHQQYLAENPAYDDDAVRFKIIELRPEVAQLFEHHGKLFEHVTSRDFTEEDERLVWYMIERQRSVEKGTSSEAQGDIAVSEAVNSRFIPKQEAAIKSNISTLKPLPKNLRPKRQPNRLTGSQLRKMKREQRSAEGGNEEPTDPPAEGHAPDIPE